MERLHSLLSPWRTQKYRLLIDAQRELGIEFKADAEDERRADVFKVLNLSREVARESLFEGRWT